MTTDTGNTENQNEAAVQPSQCCDLLLRDHVEMVTKAILFEDCGNTRDWQDNIDLGRAAITAYRPAVQVWRNDALEAAAKIAERYGQICVANDIRALIAQ